MVANGASIVQYPATVVIGKSGNIFYLNRRYHQVVLYSLQAGIVENGNGNYWVRAGVKGTVHLREQKEAMIKRIDKGQFDMHNRIR